MANEIVINIETGEKNIIFHEDVECDEKEVLDKLEAEELHRPLTESEVFNLVLKQQVNTASIDDQLSLRMKSYYPTLDEIIGQTVKLGFKFTYKDVLYKTRQDNLTIQAIYPPSIETSALYERIDETHLGNKYDPIPYEKNMELFKDKYYTQYGVMYLCTVPTGQATIYDLKDLVGLNVEVVN